MPFPNAEYGALTESGALLDLSERGRICVLGKDREKFLHGQVTNDVLRLKAGEGCYAALVNSKGRIEADLFIYKLADELLLDFEPGLTQRIVSRLEKYVIAEDVQIVDVSPHYALLSIQGPKSGEVLRGTGLFKDLPRAVLDWSKISAAEGDIYLIRNDRFGPIGFDLFIPAEAKGKIYAVCQNAGLLPVSLESAETVRIENAIPRFGVDMDENHLAPETGIQNRAISYSKGCYIGQEVIARIRTYGQVAKALRLLRIEGEGGLPVAGERLLKEGKDTGHITSSTFSPKWRARVAFGYVRKETNALGSVLSLANSNESAVIVEIPGEAS